MSTRVFGVAISVALAAAAASLPSRQVSAQARAPLKGTIARTADGHPDLQGTYDVSTMTPVQRLPGVTKLVLTPLEAAAQ
jgi:hypothetical protein